MIIHSTITSVGADTRGGRAPAPARLCRPPLAGLASGGAGAAGTAIGWSRARLDRVVTRPPLAREGQPSAPVSLRHRRRGRRSSPAFPNTAPPPRPFKTPGPLHQTNTAAAPLPQRPGHAAPISGPRPKSLGRAAIPHHTPRHRRAAPPTTTLSPRRPPLKGRTQAPTASGGAPTRTRPDNTRRCIRGRPRPGDPRPPVAGRPRRCF